MKFGRQILDKSVPEWKLHNLDYQKLKNDIKRITSHPVFNKANLTKQHDYEVIAFDGLRKLFMKEVGNINLFVSLQLKEIHSKLTSLETAILRLTSSIAENSNSREIQRKKLKRIKIYLENCNNHLQKLSRFHIVQRIGLRKLLKKLTKHFPGDKAIVEHFQDSLLHDIVESKYPDGASFLSLDLEPYLLEIGLISNILNALSNKVNSKIVIKKSDPGAFSPIDRTCPSHNVIKQGKSEKIKFKIDTDEQFDMKYFELPSVIRLLVKDENINELKFLLTKLDFNVFNKQLQLASKRILTETENTITREGSHTVRSVKSFQDLRDQQLLTMSSYSKTHENIINGKKNTCNNTNSPQSPNDISCNSRLPAFNTTKYQMLGQTVNSSPLGDHDRNDHKPNMLVFEKGSQNDCIVLADIGGLRGYTISNTLSRDLIESIMDADRTTIEDLTKNKLSNKDNALIKWLITNKINHLGLEIETKRSRFIKFESDQIFLVSLEENIRVDDKLLTPHAILDIRRLSLLTLEEFDLGATSTSEVNAFLSLLLDRILESKIFCYPLPMNYTLWDIASKFVLSNVKMNLASMILSSQCELSGKQELSDDTFFQLGREELEELRLSFNNFSANRCEKTNHTMQSYNHREGKQTKLNFVAGANPRYWNEFDDEEEFQNDTYFYDEDDIESQNARNQVDYGLLSFNKTFICQAFELCERLRDIFGITRHIPVSADASLFDDSSKYGSTAPKSSTSESLSSGDIRQLMLLYENTIQSSDEIYAYKHDEVLTYMYFLALCISCLTSGICLGIILVIFRENSRDYELSISTALTTMILGSLLASLFLICWCLALLCSRYTLAPIWHYVFSFMMLLVVIGTVTYGIVEIFV